MSQLSVKFSDLLWIYFIVVDFFKAFKHADIKGVRQQITSAVSLDNGHCEMTIPIVQALHEEYRLSQDEMKNVMM